MKPPHIRLCLVLHNHQPVGNFEHVFEDAYQDSYLPFLDVFEPFTELRLSLHTSGPLATWLLTRHPEYMSRLSNLVSQGRIEIVGGAFYEPILAMIPSRDRRGQILRYSHWLKENLGGDITGMWVPERVWESDFTNDLADSGITYTVLDDFHFRRAGLNQDALTGYFVTENDGRILRIFPGSETLRYLIPFKDPDETIQYCRQLANSRPGSVLVFGDDGEKFGTWPETKVHVYQNGWLRRFLEALVENKDWLVTNTLAQAAAETSSRGKVYLPDSSYREMTEWALSVERQLEYQSLVHQFEHHPQWPQIQRYVAGGYWRNFKVRYPESNEMYARMMYVSRRLAQAESNSLESFALERARDHLYQAQCNCGYWHGAFGGIYLPHLRNAIYRHLIAADNLLEATSRTVPWIDAEVDDYDFDAANEVRLANDHLVVWIAPAQGGILYELDLRESEHNLLATIQRRPEPYHLKVRQGQQENIDQAASIHDRVVFKQPGLENCLDYDPHLRKTLIDHFWDADVMVQDVANGSASDCGDFTQASYDATLRRNPDRIQVVLKRNGIVAGHSITITKGITLQAGTRELEIAYMLEHIPGGVELHFGVECNFAGMPDGQDDRYFLNADKKKLGQLGSVLDLLDQPRIELVDRWLNLSAGLHFENPARVWTFPIRSVSLSESGFELVHQSVVVQPHWRVRADKHGRWVTRFVIRTGSALDKSTANQGSICVAAPSGG